MKQFLRVSLLLLLVSAFVTSCKKSVPKLTRHIPKNAVFVATINSKSIQSKLLKSQATIENIMKAATGSDTSIDKGKKEWEDLKNAGIDFDDNFYVSVVQKGDGSGKTMVMSAMGTLKDAAKLEAYIKKKSPQSEVRKEKDYTYMSMGGDNVVAWNKEMVIAMGYEDYSASSNMEFDSTTGQFHMNKPANSSNNVKTEIASYFNMKEDESVASLPEFRDMASSNSDAAFWVNSGSSLNNLPIQMPKVKELVANAYTAATINFEDGKIAMDTKSYYGKDLSNILKSTSSPNADLDLVEHYPSDNINGFAVFAFNPQIIYEAVKFLEVGGMVDAYLTKAMGMTYTLQDALKAIKGDVAVVVSDFAVPEKKPNEWMPVPKAQMIMNIPVGDKDQYRRIMDKLVEQGMFVKSTGMYQLSSVMNTAGVQVQGDDKNFFVTTDLNLLNQYKAKSRKAGFKKDALDDLKGKSCAIYVDIESLLNGVKTTGDANGDVVLSKARETFKDAKAYANPFNGKSLEGHAELRFKNEKENSLGSLLSFIETTTNNMKKTEGKSKMNDDVMGDSTTAIP